MDFDSLDELLPRYLRQVWASDRLKTSTECADGMESLQANEQTRLYRVQWNPLFCAVPGWTKLSQHLPHYKSLGLFPMDIASSLAVYALGLPSGEQCTVLDLCCCPGAKLRMIADSLSPSSTVVGVDLSTSRLQVCKSLLESWEELLCQRETASARQLLFHCDGARFGEDSLGSLLFDSHALRNDLAHSRDRRKRKNKSGRSREQKRLKAVESALHKFHKASSSSSSSLISCSAAASDASHALEGGSKDCEDEAEEEQTAEAIDCRAFDFVLVDAECTHDASYRHMKFVDKGHKWKDQDDNKGEKKGEEEEQREGLSLSHNIRDLKTSSEGRLSLRETQRSLIENGLRRLRAGGTLVYSTCSQEEEQNEEIVHWLLERHRDACVEPLLPVLRTKINLDTDTPSSLSAEQPLSAYINNVLSSNAVSKEDSTRFCRTICSQRSISLESGCLEGTIRVGFTSGMSGHFVARIKKN